MNVFDFATFSGAFGWIIAHGYPLMFVAMLFEGPIVTAAAAFAAALGYFDVFIVFLLSIFGDLLSDVTYYLVGYYGRLMVVQKFGRHFGWTDERTRKVENLLNKHPNKTLVALKLTPVLPTPGLMVVGASRMPFKKFITVCSVVILPKTIFFLVLGYYFGSAYTVILSKYEKGGMITGIIIFVIFGVYYAVRKFSAHIAKNLEKT